jgi:hypothetical protein
VKVTFLCPGNNWCFSIPREYTFDGIGAEPYTDLKVGDVIVTNVGHADYNTATFDVELEVEKVSVDTDGTIYCVIKFLREVKNV